MPGMRCELYRVDPPALIDALAAPALVRSYLADLAAEQAALADRQLAAHLRRMTALAARLLADGFPALARQDAAAADALLTDLCAVATWRGWALPLVRLDGDEASVDGLPRGLLGADPGGGAGLWLLDHATLALARDRQPGEADWELHHPRGRAG